MNSNENGHCSYFYDDRRIMMILHWIFCHKTHYGDRRDGDLHSILTLSQANNDHLEH